MEEASLKQKIFLKHVDNFCFKEIKSVVLMGFIAGWLSAHQLARQALF